LLLVVAAGQGCPGPGEGGDGSTQVGSSNSSNPGGSTSGGSGGSTSGGSGGSGGGATVVVDVHIDNYVFTPKSVTIQAGQAVRWISHDFVSHSVRSGNPEDADKGSLFRSGAIFIGNSFQYTFQTPGTYHYHDEYYYTRPTMRDGTVTVLP
jgi:plastocyanin